MEAREEGANRLLSADDILGSEDIEIVDIKVPEWGGTVRIRGLSGDALSRYFEANKGRETADVTAKLLSMSIIREDGSLMFNEDQVERLKKKSNRALMRVQRAVLKLNGLDKDGDKTEETKVKNV